MLGSSAAVSCAPTNQPTNQACLPAINCRACTYARMRWPASQPASQLAVVVVVGVCQLFGITQCSAVQCSVHAACTMWVVAGQSMHERALDRLAHCARALVLAVCGAKTTSAMQLERQ